ncbi:unnamed protein product [Durusdinium trenchii]|uniref:Uncharacterized protein n=1 Tax=Durusdinium trenchii TaxID=1381693 RepID=A0ABP0JGW3_9DINO
MGCGASVVDEALAKQKRQGDRAREPSKVPRGHSVKVKVESLKSLEDRHHQRLLKFGKSGQAWGSQRAQSYTSLMPRQVIDGQDVVDMEADGMLEHKSSWNTIRWPAAPPGVRAPGPPNRRRHDEHLEKGFLPWAHEVGQEHTNCVQ